MTGDSGAYGLVEQVLAETFATRIEAEAALLDAFEGLPRHAEIIKASVWQFASRVPHKGGKWTWKLRVALNIGGYDTREQTTYQRRLSVLLALQEERDHTAATAEGGESGG